MVYSAETGSIPSAKKAEVSTHTPGPWLLEKSHDDGTFTIWTRQPHTGELAVVMTEDINGKWPVAANARLMAASPELLAALRRLLAATDNANTPTHGQDCRCVFHEALTAIAKATGQ